MWQMAHCFSVAYNFERKFGKEIELPFTSKTSALARF